MRKKIVIFLICALLILVTITFAIYNTNLADTANIPCLYKNSFYSPPQGGGNTYYVSTTGNDNNPGTLSSPWRHIQKAFDSVNPGDIVYVRDGKYYERVTLKRCGTADAWITIKNYPGETPIIDGTGITDYGWGGGLVQIGENALSSWSPLPSRGFWGVEYIVFDGFTVQNTNLFPNLGRGVGIETNFCRYVVIQNCTTKNTGAPGIANYNGHEEGLDGPGTGWDPQPHPHHLYILNNHVINANSGFPKVGEALEGGSCCEDVFVIGNIVGPTKYEGISAGYGSKRITIAYNEVTSNGVNIYTDAGGRHIQDFWIYANYCHGKGDGYAMGLECPDHYTSGGSIRNVYIYNNIFASIQYHGVTGIEEAPGIRQNIQIINNVIDVPGGAIGMTYLPSDAIFEDVIIRNNIIYGGYGGILIDNSAQPTSELTVDHNFWAWGCTSQVMGTDYLTGDPKVADRENNDYHLQATSTAIDAGSSIGNPSTDFDGNIRPQGKSADIGAYEYASNGNNKPPNKPTINGKINGKINTEYEYKFVSTDPEADDVTYCINWGDDSEEIWIGPYPSGLETSIIHNWSKRGNYITKVKARDIYGAESEWATFEVRIHIPILQLLTRISERYPFLEKILNQL